jgi:Holliday junction resolvase RusA-like endonuclease
MTPIELYIPGIPIAQPRTKGRKQGAFVRVYTPSDAEPFKQCIRLVASQAYSGPPLEGALRVEMMFVFPRPKSMVWKTKPMPRCPKATKPDADNVAKAALDALKAIWHDDGQAAQVLIEKWIASGHEQPHTTIRILEALL